MPSHVQGAHRPFDNACKVLLAADYSRDGHLLVVSFAQLNQSEPPLCELSISHYRNLPQPALTKLLEGTIQGSVQKLWMLFNKPRVERGVKTCSLDLDHQSKFLGTNRGNYRSDFDSCSRFRCQLV